GVTPTSQGSPTSSCAAPASTATPSPSNTSPARTPDRQPRPAFGRSARQRREPSDHDVPDHGPVVVAQALVLQVTAEQVAEGVLVGHLEDAVRADHHVHVTRGD